MSHQFEEGWYPECRKCGCGNLGDNAVCIGCYNELLKLLKNIIKENPEIKDSNENRNKMLKSMFGK